MSGGVCFVTAELAVLGPDGPHVALRVEEGLLEEGGSACAGGGLGEESGVALERLGAAAERVGLEDARVGERGELDLAVPGGEVDPARVGGGLAVEADLLDVLVDEPGLVELLVAVAGLEAGRDLVAVEGQVLALLVDVGGPEGPAAAVGGHVAVHLEGAVRGALGVDEVDAAALGLLGVEDRLARRPDQELHLGLLDAAAVVGAAALDAAAVVAEGAQANLAGEVAALAVRDVERVVAREGRILVDGVLDASAHLVAVLGLGVALAADRVRGPARPRRRSAWKGIYIKKKGTTEEEIGSEPKKQKEKKRNAKARLAVLSS
jgi:hypothetical protein